LDAKKLMEASKEYLAAEKLMKRLGNEEKALSLLQLAVEQGDVNAMYALGTWYLHGKIVKKNVAKAIRLIRRAAEANVAQASFDLAVCYELGDGVRKSMSQAAKFFFRSFLFGDKDAAVELERLFYWELSQVPGRVLSREIGRFLASMGR
jgi:TPR repeat protein